MIGEVDVRGATTHPLGDGRQFSQPVLRLQAVQYYPHPIILNIKFNNDRIPKWGRLYKSCGLISSQERSRSSMLGSNYSL